MECKAKCRFCHHNYAYRPGGTTTTLNRHLDKCTIYLNKLAKAKAQGTLDFPLADGSMVVHPTEYDHDHTKLLIARMIILHDYPFRIVEHKGFNALMKWMNPSYEFIGRKAIKSECMKLYESEKEHLRKSLREAETISLTTDMWTSNQNLQYMCLVAHYIDVNWVLQCRVLNFVEVEPPHTGIVIAQAIFDCLVDWKIEDKVMTITLDNASNNDTAVSNLKSKLAARKNAQFDPDYFHVRCAAHIVNLVVNDGLQQIQSLITNVRNTVKYFKKSPARMYKFVGVCNTYSIKVGRGLSIDVKTRWSSTYRMLETCIEYRNGFDYYAESDTKYEWLPLQSEWDLFEKIQPILGTMSGATTAFSGSTYPTANVFYPYIAKVKIAILASRAQAQTALLEAARLGQQSRLYEPDPNDVLLVTMADAMLEKFNKYWENTNNIMIIATILDPRFKMRYIRWCFSEFFGETRCVTEVAAITDEMEKLYRKYERICRHNQGGNSPHNGHSASSSISTTTSLASIIPSGFQSFLQSNAKESSKSELLIYLDEPNVSLEDSTFNLLNYWKVNAHRFPVVSNMAKRFLAVPASSVSSESTFSTGGRILDDYRSSLKPETVQALVCASSWIRASQNDNSAPIPVGENGDDDIEIVDFPNCVVASN
ncbi:zinc finger BED domain-containing protein RICESLEEPER 2-like [Oryza sativa Japonica Group]|uniref:zinc finger BED domain-containing protein RICESLEEPER 2-like n=1 Tax=Oryza sativa subsp. japonica TaxID=39947 RepID=UPI000E1BE243|nr:zinc finger BED domain-containing protein RICESLEEPER 2-like [Oryza sativa Japonica Group]